MTDIQELHEYASKVYRAATRAIGRGVALDSLEVYAPTDAFAEHLQQRTAEEITLTSSIADQQNAEAKVERDLENRETGEGFTDPGDALEGNQLGDDRSDESKKMLTHHEQSSSKSGDTEEERRLHFAEIENRIAEEDARIASEEGLDRKPGLSRGR